MKKPIIVAALLAMASAASAADAPLWMRYPAISPDGQTIAFCYKGDIFTVPSTGGKATQITSNSAYDTKPVWSPDGKRIAFASSRSGAFDIYIVDKDGGAPTRVTTRTGSEMPEVFIDNETLLYTSSVQPDRNDIQFPSGSFPQVYKVSVNGGRPELFSTLAMENLSFNPKDKTLLYTDKKGYEDTWRKHHQSSIARDIWICSADADKDFKKVTTFRGEDRNPVWCKDGKSFYYLSENDGTFNVYKATVDNVPGKQLTKHTKHPVRFLTSSDNGKLCYGYNGEIYTLDEGKQPVKLNVSIVSDDYEKPVRVSTMSSGVSSIAVSPNGKELAFVLRGDVYVTSEEYSTTKQITNTPQQERNVQFSPDGRSLIYSSERGETWGIYESKIVRDDDKMFTYAQEIKETPLVVGDKTSFNPKYSPDGKEVAFLEDRTTLCVINLKDKKVRKVLDGKYNYSYTDGDVDYQWSPDSKWFLTDYIGVGGWNNRDVALVKADGSEVINLTESGYSDGNPKWVLDGKAMIWQSDRAGYRSHGSWGAEVDSYIMFFDGDAYDKFLLSKEDLTLNEEREKIKKEKEKKEKEKKEKEEKEKKEADKKKDDKKNDDKKKDSDKDAKKDESKDLKFDLENRRDRVLRLTGNSSNMGDAVLNKNGDKIYYAAAFEGGHDLWVRDLKDGSVRCIRKGIGGGTMITNKYFTKLYFIQRGVPHVITLTGDDNAKNIPLEAEYSYRPAEEREYIFNHAWRQVKDKFYDPKIHGIDWEGYRKDYARFLPHINNNHDFRDMLSEMLGELNGSHTGARYTSGTNDPYTATLCAFYDESYKGDGLKIAEIIENGPLTKSNSKIEAGCIIEKIDGNPIKAGEDYYPLLAGKDGKRVVLTVKGLDGKEFEQEVKPVSYGTQNNLLYKRWVKRNREKVEEMSGGKVGYIHIKGMDSPSFRETFSDLLGRYRNYDAIIIDTRHNGGGWLHEDLAVLLSGKEFARFTPRGNYVGSDPFNRWFKPSCVLVCEDNYSNAHGFPWMYKTLGLGKLIGAPVPGTMTAVWWESQIDPSIVFGIPQVGCQDMNGKYLENQELQPDIEVYNTPEQQMAGEDHQLEVAVKEMLSQIKK